jgi:hypothetical protein
VHHDRKHGVAIKLDYEKTYDKVNWQYLLDIFLIREDLGEYGLSS